MPLERIIMDFLKFFKTPSAEELASTAIEEAKRQVLHHETQANYHKKMAEHYAESINSTKHRLLTF